MLLANWRGGFSVGVLLCFLSFFPSRHGRARQDFLSCSFPFIVLADKCSAHCIAQAVCIRYTHIHDFDLTRANYCAFSNGVTVVTNPPSTPEYLKLGWPKHVPAWMEALDSKVPHRIWHFALLNIDKPIFSVTVQTRMQYMRATSSYLPPWETWRSAYVDGCQGIILWCTTLRS